MHVGKGHVLKLPFRNLEFRISLNVEIENVSWRMIHSSNLDLLINIVRKCKPRFLFFFSHLWLLLPMDSFLDPFESPVPGGNRQPFQPLSKPSSEHYSHASPYNIITTPRPQSNIHAFRRSTLSNADTVTSLNYPQRSSVKAVDSPITFSPPIPSTIEHPDPAYQARTRPSTYPAASPLYKLAPHGYRFSVDVPINYRQLFRTLSTGRRHSRWTRSWMLKTPFLDPKIMVNPYYRIGTSTPLFQHSCATISPASSPRASTAAEVSSVATPHTAYDYLVEMPASFCSMQATLFALGFLVFPCWWIGGFYCRPQVIPGSNCSTCSSCSSSSTKKSLSWAQPLAGPLSKHQYRSELSYSQLFHLLNRAMAILSGLWIIATVSIVIWYYVGLSNGLWDSQAQNGSRLDQLNRQSKMNIST